MTLGELNEQRIEWIKTLKPGDLVCITNTEGLGTLMRTLMSGGADPKNSICITTEVQGRLSNGNIVAYDTIFDEKGEPISGNPNGVEVRFPTEELQVLAGKLQFQETVRAIEFTKFSTEAIEEIIHIIDREAARITEERVRKEAEASATKKEKEEAKKNDPLSVNDDILG